MLQPTRGSPGSLNLPCPGLQFCQHAVRSTRCLRKRSTVSGISRTRKRNNRFQFEVFAREGTGSKDGQGNGKRPSGPLRAAAVEVGEGNFAIDAEAKTGLGWFRSKYDKEIAALAIPSLCASLLYPISSTVDAAIVGRIGVAEFSGVGLASVFWMISQSLFSFLALLVTPQVAKAYAKGDADGISKATAQNLWIAGVIGLSLGVAVMFSAPHLVTNILKPSVEVQPHAIAYLRTICTAAPLSLMWLAVSGVYRGIKDTKSILGASIASSLVNLSLDVVFVFGFRWGVVGAGIATVMSSCASSLYLLWKLVGKGYLKFKHIAQVPETGDLFPFIAKGMALTTRSLFSMGLFFLASVLVARLGLVAGAAFEVSRQVVMLALNSYLALESTTQALVASYLGKGERQTAREILQRIIQIALVTSSVVGGFLLLFVTDVAQIYTSKPEVIQEIVKVAPIFLLPVPLDAVFGIVDGSLIGAEQTDFVSACHVLTSGIAIVGLLCSWNMGTLTLGVAWAFVKLGFILRGVFTSYRLLKSEKSPYAEPKRMEACSSPGIAGMEGTPS